MESRSLGKRISKLKPSTFLGLEERPRKANFFLQFTIVFAIVALVLALAAGFAVTTFLRDDIREKTLHDVETEISEEDAPRIAANLSPEALAAPLSGDTLAAFDGFIRENVLSSRTVRANVWNAEGTIVYSSVEELRGRQVPSNPGLLKALDGEMFGGVEDAGDEGSAGSDGSASLEGYTKLVEVYVPLTFEGSDQIVGVVEVYRDYTPIAAHIGDIQRSVFISIGAALAALYLAVVLLVRRGSNTIRRQQADLQSRTEELRGSYESIVAVLCSALDLRDNVTLGHAQRVSELASIVAWQMGLRKQEVREIEKAAILHDIGKIGVADAVLSKPSALDEAEWAEMKRHPELGYQILQGIDFLKDVAEIVYAHHEWFDGRGYPRRLSGEEIPLGSRIFAVVDAYDAMTSHRPYRKAMPHSKAVAEIIRNTGTQFDPQVVKAFLEAEKRGLLNGNGQDASNGELVASPAGSEV